MKTVHQLGIGLVILAVAACSSDSTSPLAPTVVLGSYTLQTINGDTVPTLLSYVVSPTDTVETDIISDVYTFNADQTFTEQTVERVTHGSTIVDQPGMSSGTYAQSGASLTISPTGGTTEQATVSGAVVTVTNGTLIEVYHKSQTTP